MMMRAFGLLLVLGISGSAIAADWPMGGRSADRNPVSLEKNPPTEWQIGDDKVKGRNIKWSVRVEAGSQAIGGPVVSGGLVWVGSTDHDPDKKIDNAVLVAYRESDGKLLYRFTSPRLKFPDDWPGQSLSGSPLAEGDYLWFCTNRREVICLDVGPLRKGTGEPREVWKLDMVKELKIHPHAVMIPGPDQHGSPAAYKEFLYIPTGNGMSDDNQTVPAPDAPSLVCLRKDTGKVVWQNASPGKDMMLHHIASPLVVEIAGKCQVIHPQADGWVRSFDAESGKLLWKFDVNRKDSPRDFRLWVGMDHENARHAVVATPVYANGRVFFAIGRDPECCGGPGRLFCIDPTKTGDVSPELGERPGKGKPNPNSAVAWEFNQDGPKKSDQMHLSISSVSVHKGLVIAVDHSGYIHCLDEKTGKQHWSHDIKAGKIGNPLIVDESIYVGSEQGDVLVFALQKTKNLIATNELDCPVRAPPVYANGVLYVLTEKTLFAIARNP